MLSKKYFLPKVLHNLNSSGLLVTTPDPLGKKSNPTTDSITELFPLLYVPSVQILGSFIYDDKPISLNLSIMLINFLKLLKRAELNAGSS